MKRLKNLERIMVRDGICGESAGEKMAIAVSNSFCCFLPNISLYTKFHRNWKKNTEVLVGFGRLGYTLGRKIVMGIYNLFYVVFGPLLKNT